MPITASHYKDQPAITLESDVISAQFLPSIGSKMCSLVYKPLQRELMVQNASEKYLLQPDHGEVWSLKWNYTINVEQLFMSTYGVRFPYKLEKVVSFTSPHILHTKYV